MPAAFLDIYADRYATFNTTITIVDVNNNPINLVPYTANSLIRKSYITPNVEAAFTITNIDPVNGVIELSLDYSITANIWPSPPRYVYDVIIRNTVTNIATRVLEGSLFINPGVSPSP